MLIYHIHPLCNLEMRLQKNNPAFIRMALFASKTFIVFLSVFIVDYMKMFPVIIEDFKRLDEETQKILTFYNDTFREPQIRNL